MEQKSSIATYQEKLKESHTQEEILGAFDNGFALSTAPVKAKLIAAMCEVAPDVIVTTSDLCTFGTEPNIARDQLLVIYTGGDKKTANRLVAILEESGAVDSVLVVMSEKKDDIKGCYRRTFDSDKPAIIRRANLIPDGEHLVLSVRTFLKK